MSLWDGHIPLVQAEKPFHDACYSPNKKEDIDACRKFCAETGIEYYVIDVSGEYNRQVLDYVTKEYRSGKTPNPCIRCNSFIKFGALLEGLKKLDIGYDYFCTGHYAMVVRPVEGIWGTDKRPAMIACALDDLKDQTYFLYRLDSNLLEKVRFPLAFMKKSEVFKLAKEAGLDAADKKESQDFVWVGNVVPDSVVEAWGKIRLRSKGALCQVEKVESDEKVKGSANETPKWKISFFEKQNAITPGQSVVLYKDNVIIGGGIISEVVDE